MKMKLLFAFFATLASVLAAPADFTWINSLDTSSGNITIVPNSPSNLDLLKAANTNPNINILADIPPDFPPRHAFVQLWFEGGCGGDSLFALFGAGELGDPVTGHAWCWPLTFRDPPVLSIQHVESVGCQTFTRRSDGSCLGVYFDTTLPLQGGCQNVLESELTVTCFG